MMERWQCKEVFYQEDWNLINQEAVVYLLYQLNPPPLEHFHSHFYLDFFTMKFLLCYLIVPYCTLKIDQV